MPNRAPVNAAKSTSDSTSRAVKAAGEPAEHWRAKHPVRAFRHSGVSLAAEAATRRALKAVRAQRPAAEAAPLAQDTPAPSSNE